MLDELQLTHTHSNQGNNMGPNGAVSIAKLIKKLPALETLFISGIET